MIDCSRAVPDLEDLVAQARPVVLKGLVRDWPLVQQAGESASAFAQEIARHDTGVDVDTLWMAPEHGGHIGYLDDFSAFNYRHFRIPVTLGLQRLAQYSRQDHPPGVAIQSAAMGTCLPALQSSHRLPFLPPSVEPRIWIGNRVTTPPHYDEYQNIACVVCGTRRFTLFPPEQVRNLYVGPLDFAPTGAAISMARLDQPADPRYPRIAQALEHALVGDLQPGDAIYIPPLWWHQVESLEPLNALVNFWWMPVAAPGEASGTAMGCLMHCLLTFRTLPPAQRRAWRAMLDYYLFDEEDPGAHIPAAKRGLLGPLDPERRAAYRERIRSYLQDPDDTQPLK